MIHVRPLDDIHRAEGGSFTGYRHFSFDDYQDPRHTRFGALRVFNVDTLEPGGVRPMHRDENMELVTYCVDGRLRHADSIGNDHVLLPGGVQHTTLGSGLAHTEINDSDTEPMTFLQMWFWPEVRGLTPKVQQRQVGREERLDRWLPLASPHHADAGALPIRSEAEVWASTLAAGRSIPFALGHERGAYIYVVRGGPVRASDGGDSPGERLERGSAAEVTDVRLLRIAAEDEETEVLLVKVRP